MKASQLLKTLKKAGRRAHLVGDLAAGVVAALDVEGRLFAVLEGEVLNRVNPEALGGQSTRERYLNPGGDGLWPAPEGTTAGYHYSTGAWRVPPGLSAARYVVVKAAARRAAIRAEVDLVNDRGLGVPTIFQRDIRVTPGRNSLMVRVAESITYIGRATLPSADCLLAPWTLCQFDSGPDCHVVFPCTDPAGVWDLYDPSDTERTWSSSQCTTRADGSRRYQIAIGVATPWIEFRDPRRGLAVRRTAGPLPEGQAYIDIRDAAPDVPPGTNGARYSVYSDTARFMEIEAVGGCPAALGPDSKMSVVVTTRYTRT